jgi:hypothetical protein
VVARSAQRTDFSDDALKGLAVDDHLGRIKPVCASLGVDLSLMVFEHAFGLGPVAVAVPRLIALPDGEEPVVSLLDA